jgi:hypothetical protein
VIEGFNMWVNPISNNTVVCFDSFNDALTTIANDCVHSVRTTLTGPKNYFLEKIQQSPPFSIFGVGLNGAANASKLPYPGNYTLTTVPDGFVEKTKTVTFNVAASQVGISLYDATLKTINTTNFVSGNSVCINRSFSWEFNLFCGFSYRATLTGPPGFTMRERAETSQPFTFYGRVNYVTVGKTLTAVGNYTLTVYPNQIVSDSMKVIKFSAKKC